MGQVYFKDFESYFAYVAREILNGQILLWTGWTKDGKIIIDAYVDIEGNPKPRFDNKGQYEGDLKSRYLIYDPLSMKLIKEVPQEFKKINIMLKKDTTISPDGKKKIFWEEKNLGVMDMDGENKKILLKDKVRYLK